jgi:hypothetical protein
VRILADLNIAPRTVEFLRSLGHDTARVDAGAWGAAADLAIVEAARREHRTVLTQDLDFSAIVALSGRAEGVQRVPRSPVRRTRRGSPERREARAPDEQDDDGGENGEDPEPARLARAASMLPGLRRPAG